MQTKNLLLVGDFNAPNVNWNDITTSCHYATFDARILSICLDNFLMQHSVWATRWVLGQRETCLDLVFTKTSEGANHWETAIIYRFVSITFVSRALTPVIKGNVTYGRVILKA